MRKTIGIVSAFVILAIFQSLHFPESLTPAGHALLSVLLFMLVLWVTEAVGYATSSFFLIVSMTLLVGFSPDLPTSAKLIGTDKALGMALSGFSSTAWVLVVAALFLAAAIEKTGLGGLDRFFRSESYGGQARTGPFRRSSDGICADGVYTGTGSKRRADDRRMPGNR
jgi:di/tricarboxylate transporter